MPKENNQKSKSKANPIDDYLNCLSYCDIYSKGIDKDCEIICMERHLKSNYW